LVLTEQGFGKEGRVRVVAYVLAESRRKKDWESYCYGTLVNNVRVILEGGQRALVPCCQGGKRT